MTTGTARLKFYAPCCHSLKEKRMIVNQLMARVKNKFNVSIAEVAEMDRHQTIVLGLACVSNSGKMVQAVLDQVIRFVEGITEAELIEVVQDVC